MQEIESHWNADNHRRQLVIATIIKWKFKENCNVMQDIIYARMYACTCNFKVEFHVQCCYIFTTV